MPRTLTDERAIEALTAFVADPKTRGIAFALAMETEKGVIVHERPGQPCWGELRTYDEARDGYRKPWDLKHPFPDGTPVGIGVYLQFHAGCPSLHDWMLGPTSPWRSCFGETGSFERLPRGFLVTDTHIDPNVLLHLLLNIKPVVNSAAWDEMVKCGVNPATAYLIQGCLGYGKNFTLEFGPTHPYHFNPFMDLTAWYSGKPHSIPPNDTFYNRAPYNRPDITDIFKGSFNVIKTLRPHFTNGNHLTLEEAIEKLVPVIEEARKEGELACAA
jgi:hypothetical protein